MEKKLIVRFLKERKRGCYKLLVQIYAAEILSIPVVMALEIIRDDLQKESAESINLNYFSLARAVNQFKKKNSNLRKVRFKDANEITDGLPAGKFKLD